MKNRDHILRLKDNYIKVPQQILRLNLDCISICIYTLFCSVNKEFNPSIGFIARVLGIHKNTVTQKLKQLETCGMIKKLSSGYNVSKDGKVEWDVNKYELTNPKTWVALDTPVRKKRSDAGKKLVAAELNNETDHD